MDLMDKRLTTGVIDSSKTKRYEVRTPSILTIGQNLLAKNGDLYKTYEFNHTSFTNLLGVQLDINFNYIGNEKVYETMEVAKAYYFQVDSDAVVTIDDYDGTSWATLITIPIVGITKTTAYKGYIIPRTGAKKSRIVFNGTNFYRILNVALFAEPFTYDQVPVYNSWVEYTMPSDFKSVNQIIESSPLSANVKDSNFNWQERNKLFVSYDFTGTQKVIYVPTPNVITSLSQEIEIDDTSAINTLTYFLATQLLLIEDPESSSFFNQMYMESKNNMKEKQPSPIEDIEDCYLETVNTWGGDYFG